MDPPDQQLVPPPPFADFDFSLTPATSEVTPYHSSLMVDYDLSRSQVTEPSTFPPALLSTSEQTDLLGFLDRFEWDFDPALPSGLPEFPKSHLADENHPALTLQSHPLSDNAASTLLSDSPSQLENPLRTSSSNPTPIIAIQPAPAELSSQRPAKRRKSSPSDDPSLKDSPSSALNEKPARKPLLTQPQKRLNHIMSEQRRRTAIKEGFIAIEKLIAPDPSYTGPPPTLPIPLDKDGKPKKGVKAKALRGKGKMGSLFRASEFLGFLEQGIAALESEVERLESVVRSSAPQSTSAMYTHPHILMEGIPHHTIR
ncbi:hypothetical protein FRB99_002122 [Tulasnella sp. 403]|nr:hypothetical protein FRB99_002122 [Tulasnella sp. 403]